MSCGPVDAESVGIGEGWSDAGSIAGVVCSRERMGCEGRFSDGEDEVIGLEDVGCVEGSPPGITFSFSLSASAMVTPDDFSTGS